MMLRFYCFCFDNQKKGSYNSHIISETDRVSIRRAIIGNRIIVVF